MRILTIIISYNFEKWMDKCLGSLYNSSYPTDIVIIDNKSQDDTINNLYRCHPTVQVIRNEKNLGFGQANNIGIKKAIDEQYDAVFLLNQDAWIDSDVLSKFVSCSDNNPDIAIFSPVHLNGKGNDLDFGFSVYSSCQNKDKLPQTDAPVIVPFINAAFWFIPTKHLKLLGGFSPVFYHYGEDVDYVNRAHYHGLSVAFIPNAYAYHDREKRKTSREAFLRSEKVYHLSEYTNLNYNLCQAFAYCILAAIKKSFKDMAYTKIIWQLLLITHQVLKARKEAKRYCAFIK